MGGLWRTRISTQDWSFADVMEIRGKTRRYRATLDVLRQKLVEEQQGLIFLGAGASVFPRTSNPTLMRTSSDEEKATKRLPTAAKLSETLANEIELEWHQYVPLSTIAFYYESYYGRDGLNKRLQRELAGDDLEVPLTIQRVVDLVVRLEEEQAKNLVITTNFDRLFEVAYEQETGRSPEVIIYNGGNDPNTGPEQLHLGWDGDPRAWFPQQSTALYKMHGCISHAEGRNLVVTEEDYINFLANSQGNDYKKKLFGHVLGRLAMSTILFVGYSLSDWNFRVIYKATGEANGMQSYAVQYFDHEAEHTELEAEKWATVVQFWGDKDVHIINCDASQFMGDLLEACRRPLAAKESA